MVKNQESNEEVSWLSATVQTLTAFGFVFGFLLFSAWLKDVL